MVSNLLFSRRRLREKVRPPVYRLGGCSLAASCQPQAAPALAHIAYACLAALRCASAGPAPARERHWPGTANAGRGSHPLNPTGMKTTPTSPIPIIALPWSTIIREKRTKPFFPHSMPCSTEASRTSRLSTTSQRRLC